MNIFIVCLEAVLPIFIMMLIGYGSRRFSLLDEGDVRRFNKVLFRIFMPVMLFYNIYTSELESAIKPGLLLYAALGVVVMIIACTLFSLKVEKLPSRQGVMTQGLYRSNFALVGIPVAEALMQGGDVSAVAVMLAVVVPLFNLSAVIILESFNGRKPDIKHMMADVLKNPLIIGTVSGLIFLALDIRLPKVLLSVAEDMSDIAGPLALFLLGAFFRFGTVKKYKKELLIVCTGRLIVIPAIFLSLGYVLGFRGAEFAGIIALFASCTAIASFTMTEQMGGDSELAGDIVVATSFLCSFTMYFWALIFMSLGAF